VCQRHVLADRERLRYRQEADQPVLEPCLLGGIGSAAERAEALVDLYRVGRDRYRVLPAPAQQLGKLDRDRRLADSRRPEDG
jgi:hypothetical protein